ncbi:MAG: anthranilate phosphoribosyltransferase [Candidatus Omnitrophica bacterium]|nr:anthranilate phosphoribosyltransferase [Candidatus Omnitrophota bacterium]
MDIKQAIKKLTLMQGLKEDEMHDVFALIMNGECTPSQIGGFLVALKMKTPSLEEITAAAKVMREKAVKICVGNKETLLDTCGTGGSGKDTFNVSTLTAFVVSGAGVKVAKHGNRSFLGNCGSADILEELGVKIDVEPQVTEKCIKEIGIGFLFAPKYHLAMKHAIAPRKELGVSTIFNILGPLSNPASATCHLIGVFDPGYTEIMANVLKNLGTKRAFVVHGMDGLDEITLSDKTKVSELKNGKVVTYYIDPEQYGLKIRDEKEFKGLDKKNNALKFKEILSGGKGPLRDLVIFNSAAALVVADKAIDMKEGIKIAAESIDTGKAMEKLKKLAEITGSN